MYPMVSMQVQQGDGNIHVIAWDRVGDLYRGEAESSEGFLGSVQNHRRRG